MKRKSINCQEAEELSNGYIKKNLTAEELRLFMRHIEECPKCREDIETYFIVDAALKQLDKEDEDILVDLKTLLEMDIKKRKRFILRGMFVQYIKEGISILIRGLLLVMIGFCVYVAVSLLTTYLL